jgi:hypothetical protein
MDRVMFTTHLTKFISSMIICFFMVAEIVFYKNLVKFPATNSEV